MTGRKLLTRFEASGADPDAFSPTQRLDRDMRMVDVTRRPPDQECRFTALPRHRQTEGRSAACKSPMETSLTSPIEMSRSSVCERPIEVAWDDGDHGEPQRADAPAGADRY